MKRKDSEKRKHTNRVLVYGSLQHSTLVPIIGEETKATSSMQSHLYNSSIKVCFTYTGIPKCVRIIAQRFFYKNFPSDDNYFAQ